MHSEDGHPSALEQWPLGQQAPLFHPVGVLERACDSEKGAKRRVRFQREDDPSRS
jgi:hypothetical protein